MKNLVLTGVAGFIGSCMLGSLNANGYQNIIIVDEFEREDKKENWKNKTFKAVIDRKEFIEWLNNEDIIKIDAIIHLGAKTDTTEFNYTIHEELNVRYSQQLWDYCTKQNIPFIYASSAATYGAGENGYDDDESKLDLLKPLNPYGVSKNEFDKWALVQNSQPKYWTGLKFFNVYGPNEYHKGRMASVIWHSFNQIKKDGQVKLFKSHRPDFEDGKQLRDFIYVKDLISVINWLLEKMLANEWKEELNGIYNLGTGEARSFYDLVSSTFAGMNLETNIEYIDMPIDIRDKYQYYTQANMNKLINAGYTKPFYSLEEGVVDYVKNYLVDHKYF